MTEHESWPAKVSVYLVFTCITSQWLQDTHITCSQHEKAHKEMQIKDHNL